MEELKSRIENMNKNLQMKCDEVSKVGFCVYPYLQLQSRLVSVVSERDAAIAQTKDTHAHATLPLVLPCAYTECVDRDLPGKEHTGGEIETGDGHAGGEKGERNTKGAQSSIG